APSSDAVGASVDRAAAPDVRAAETGATSAAHYLRAMYTAATAPTTSRAMAPAYSTPGLILLMSNPPRIAVRAANATGVRCAVPSAATSRDPSLAICRHMDEADLVPRRPRILSCRCVEVLSTSSQQVASCLASAASIFAVLVPRKRVRCNIESASAP